MNKISFHEIEAKSYELPKKQFATIERSVTKALDLRNDCTNRPFEMEHVTVPPSKKAHTYHAHGAAQWELYWIIKGSAQMRFAEGFVELGPAMRFSALQGSLISSLIPVTLSLNIGSFQVIRNLIPATIPIATRFPFTSLSRQTRRVLQGGLSFQKAEPTTIGRARNKWVGSGTAKTLSESQKRGALQRRRRQTHSAEVKGKRYIWYTDRLWKLA